MGAFGKWARYLVAALLFLLTYAVIGSVAHFIIGIVNSDARGWLADYIVPIFVAALAGGFGAAGGLAVIERWMPSVRLRPIAWFFICIVALIYAWTAIAILAGSPAEEGLAAMAMQSLVAAVTTWRMSARLPSNMSQV